MVKIYSYFYLSSRTCPHYVRGLTELPAPPVRPICIACSMHLCSRPCLSDITLTCTFQFITQL